MRRADRLFEIVQQLRGDRMVTAAVLAERLEVSARTIYRDIGDLQSSGVPIDGAAGVGYLLRPGYQLPPLMFRAEEVEALIVGARMVQAWAGKGLASAAAEALVKIGAVVPDAREGERENLDALSRAIDDRLRVRIAYRNEEDDESDRTIWPLALHFWGRVWTLAAWCELRQDFRTSGSTAPRYRSPLSGLSRSQGEGWKTTLPESGGLTD